MPPQAQKAPKADRPKAADVTEASLAKKSAGKRLLPLPDASASGQASNPSKPPSLKLATHKATGKVSSRKGSSAKLKRAVSVGTVSNRADSGEQSSRGKLMKRQVKSAATEHNSVWTTVFGNPDLVDKIVTHVTFETLAVTVLQLNRAFCNAAQQRLRCALPLLAPPFRMQPRQILESAVLNLSGRHLGDDDVSAIASACANGAMANCRTLGLNDNQIGDVGIAAFAQAIKPVSEGGNGALAQLQVSALSTALDTCLKPWHACSPRLAVSCDVPFVPCAGAPTVRQQDRRRRHNGFGRCVR